MDKVEYDGVKLDIQGNHATNLPFPDETFDVVYYDPPYYFKEFVKDKGVGALYADDREIYWTLDDFKHSLTGLRREVPRVLKKGGILICKIMDSYVGRTYFPNTFAVFNCFSQLLSPVGVFIVPIHRENYPDAVRVNHINYLVFKKGVDATQYRVGYDIYNLLNDTDSAYNRYK
jgi:SAM-dependent methyltransferase